MCWHILAFEEPVGQSVDLAKQDDLVKIVDLITDVALP